MGSYGRCLFVVFSAITKVAHPFVPRFATAALEGVTHKRFNLLVADAIFSLNIIKADVI